MIGGIGREAGAMVRGRERAQMTPGRPATRARNARARRFPPRRIASAADIVIGKGWSGGDGLANPR